MDDGKVAAGLWKFDGRNLVTDGYETFDGWSLDRVINQGPILYKRNHLDRTKPRRGMIVNCSERPRPRRAGMRVKTAVKSSTCRQTDRQGGEYKNVGKCGEKRV